MMEYLRQQSHTYHRLDWNKTLSIQLDVTVTNEAKNKVRSRFTISVVLCYYALLTVGEAEGVVDGATVGEAEVVPMALKSWEGLTGFLLAGT
jgi:hypothetical protein